jgi:hypothetical protein
MLSTTLDLTPEDIRTIHHLYTFVYEFARNYNNIEIKDPYINAILRPRSPEELHEVNKLRLRAMTSMNETWQALPDDSPLLVEYKDLAELWVPYPHEIEHIKQILSS